MPDPIQAPTAQAPAQPSGQVIPGVRRAGIQPVVMHPNGQAAGSPGGGGAFAPPAITPPPPTPQGPPGQIPTDAQSIRGNPQPIPTSNASVAINTQPVSTQPNQPGVGVARAQAQPGVANANGAKYQPYQISPNYSQFPTPPPGWAPTEQQAHNTMSQNSETTWDSGHNVMQMPRQEMDKWGYAHTLLTPVDMGGGMTMRDSTQRNQSQGIMRGDPIMGMAQLASQRASTHLQEAQLAAETDPTMLGLRRAQMEADLAQKQDPMGVYLKNPAGLKVQMAMKNAELGKPGAKRELEEALDEYHESLQGQTQGGGGGGVGVGGASIGVQTPGAHPGVAAPTLAQRAPMAGGGSSPAAPATATTPQQGQSAATTAPAGDQGSPPPQAQAAMKPRRNYWAGQSAAETAAELPEIANTVTDPKLSAMLQGYLAPKGGKAASTPADIISAMSPQDQLDMERGNFKNPNVRAVRAFLTHARATNLEANPKSTYKDWIPGFTPGLGQGDSAANAALQHANWLRGRWEMAVGEPVSPDETWANSQKQGIPAKAGNFVDDIGRWFQMMGLAPTPYEQLDQPQTLGSLGSLTKFRSY